MNMENSFANFKTSYMVLVDRLVHGLLVHAIFSFSCFSQFGSLGIGMYATCEFICLFAFAFPLCVCGVRCACVKFCFYRKFTRSEIYGGGVANNNNNNILCTVRCNYGGRKSIVSM